MFDVAINELSKRLGAHWRLELHLEVPRQVVFRNGHREVCLVEHTPSRIRCTSEGSDFEIMGTVGELVCSMKLAGSATPTMFEERPDISSVVIEFISMLEGTRKRAREAAVIIDG